MSKHDVDKLLENAVKLRAYEEYAIRRIRRKWGPRLLRLYERAVAAGRLKQVQDRIEKYVKGIEEKDKRRARILKEVLRGYF